MSIKEVSAGGIVYRPSEQDLLILMIEDNKGRWSFPKGLVQTREEPPVAAIREIGEETGVQGEIIELLGQSNYMYRRQGVLIDKTVYFYLVHALSSAIKPQYEEVHDARWFTANEALRASAFQANTDLLRKAIERVGQL